jgi:hypothetical protein
MSRILEALSVAIRWGLLVTSGTLLSAHENKAWISPDEAMVARAKNFTAAGSADYTDWDIVTVRNRHNTRLASISLECGSGINRAVVTTAAWTPDARFFVFATTSSGGHSSWHMPTYVYDSSTSCIYSIDDTVGNTTDDNPQFEISKSDILKIRFWDGATADAEAAPRMIDLCDFVKNGAKLALNSHCYAPHHR